MASRKPEPPEPLPPLPPGDYGKHANERRWEQTQLVDYYGKRTEACAAEIARRERQRRRTADIPFWTAPSGYCRWCGLDLGKLRSDPRRRWHSDCAKAYRAVMGQGAIRDAVYARDGGRCIDCPPDVPPWPKFTVRIFPCGERTNAQTKTCPRASFNDTLRWQPWHRRVVLRKPHRCGPALRVGWEADHVIEVADGGAHDPANMVTRCLFHHAQKTVQARRARAARPR